MLSQCDEISSILLFLPHSFVSSIDAKNTKLRRTDPEIRQIYNVYITMCSGNVFQHKSSKTMLVFFAHDIFLRVLKNFHALQYYVYVPLCSFFHFSHFISFVLFLPHCVCTCLFFVHIQSFPFEIDRSTNKNQIATYPARSRQMYTI